MSIDGLDHLPSLAGVVDRIAAARAVAIMRWPDRDVAGAAMEAAVRGGFRALEFTLGTGGALELVERFAARGDVLVGAGTVLTVDDARAAAGAGARFVVSPVCDPAVIEEAARLGVAAIPGCATPTELHAAHRAGAPLQKLFPEPAGGPAWVSAVLGPMPFLRLVPTNGVTAANARAYLDAGAVAVGVVRALFDPADLRARRFDAVEQRARAIISAVGPHDGSVTGV